MSLNIFSPIKKKSQENPNIIVDFREKNSLVPSELISLNCIVKFQQLEIGDYLVGDYIVERKTLSDLQSSIIDKRIFSQIEKLKAQKKPVLLVESNEGWKLHENALRGIVLEILNQKIPVIFTKDSKDTAKYIFLMSKERKNNYISLRDYKKFSSKIEVQKYILEGIPGIGPKTAEKIISNFKTIKNAINAKPEEMKKLIGNKADTFFRNIN